MLRLIFFNNSWTWWCQFKFESIIIPQNFTKFSCLMFLLLICRFTVGIIFSDVDEIKRNSFYQYSVRVY